MENLPSIVTTILTSTVLATIFSSFIAYIISNKDNKLKYITEERKLWREQIRDIGTRIATAKGQHDLILALTELKLRINTYGLSSGIENSEKSKNKYLEDQHIWDIIKEIENDLSKMDEKYTFDKLDIDKKNILVNYISLLLKADWDRSKNEVNSTNKSIFFLIILLVTNTIIFYFTDFFTSIKVDFNIYFSGVIIIFCIKLILYITKKIFYMNNNSILYNISKSKCLQYFFICIVYIILTIFFLYLISEKSSSSVLLMVSSFLIIDNIVFIIINKQMNDYKYCNQVNTIKANSSSITILLDSINSKLESIISCLSKKKNCNDLSEINTDKIMNEIDIIKYYQKQIYEKTKL